jgi:hypothetical protein
LSKITVKTQTEEMVSITIKKYNQLLAAEDFLGCLEGCGVDNFSGWDDACEQHRTFIPYKGLSND